MDNQSLLEKVAQLGDQALKYGPFLFALFFNLIITNWAHSYYKNACARKDPPATESELTTYRYYFWVSGFFGICLVIASVWWWFGHQPAVYVYRGVITNLRDYENVTSSKLYFRKELKEGPQPNAPQNRDHHFVVLKEKPFKDGDTFELLYAKTDQGQSPTEIFHLKYIPDQDEASFTIQWDDHTGKYNLISLIPQQNGIAYAMQTRILAFSTTPSLTLVTTNVDLLRAPPISQLAVSSSKVHEKIAALDKLMELGNAYIEPYINDDSPEPHVLTLLDLARHTDPELSSKAKRILNQHDPNPYIVRKFFSSDEMENQRAEEILYRIERQRAEAILDLVRKENRTKRVLSEGKLDAIQRELTRGQKTRTIIPTGSRDGDLYYVRADWRASEKTGKCLADVFYTNIDHSPLSESLEEYEKRLSKANAYVVYAREKFQVIRLAEFAEKCGAMTKMIGY